MIMALLDVFQTRAYDWVNSKGVRYYLHSKTIKLRGSGKLLEIYYFCRDIRENCLAELPPRKMIVENVHTGLPMLKGKT